MAYRISRWAANDLQEIWDYIAENSGRAELATRHLEAVTLRFPFLADYPFAGRARDEDLGPGLRSLPAERHVIVYRLVGRDVLILRVAHSRRDLAALMRR